LIVSTRGGASIRPGAARWNQSTLRAIFREADDKSERTPNHGQGAIAVSIGGHQVVAVTIVKGWPFAWALLALFLLITGFISLSGSIKAAED
jgi:hypothetical protein